MLPSLFIAHGAPLLAIEKNEYTQYLQELAQTLPRPKAIVIFSAHWASYEQKVSEVEQYSTIYDFYGFPDALYEIQYPAKGELGVAKEIEKLLAESGISYRVENERGLDHGAWVVLHLMYPDANIPVVAMSVNPEILPQQAYQIGKALSALKEKDILIITSGGTVHNLRMANMASDENAADDWAVDFDKWLEKHLKAWDTESLFNYDTLAPLAELAVPPYGAEHFLPIFYAMGAGDARKKAVLLHRSYRYDNLSHCVWRFE
ncbi:dioxygenase [Weizmannia acidilactici]|uniref:Dioxygenase n=1 Tax=Weizmannia acidilactici TaxID=2607726 RepID=A0A5J4JJU2_9BACI|nr:class III extradiol ring-cleavage dioxygenase [Weizmannia acidilactici]GER68057.1 dioxygenase [Weizmannia acidilactici]GER70798.1 dioxygenase [Weizmannia acidilactici]GER74362.1 dioxygenase [Weizmannia acidilactici]